MTTTTQHPYDASGNITKDRKELYLYRKEMIPSTAALAAFKHYAPCAVLVSGYRFSGFARLKRDGSLDFGPQGKVEPKAGELFEVRAFCDTAELHWLADPATGNTTGTAVWVSDSADNPEGWTDPRASDKPHSYFVRNGQYLLWGDFRTGQETSDGWSCLYDHRVGKLWAPVSGLITAKEKEVAKKEAKMKPHTDDRAVLRVREYFAEDKEFGNVTLFAERLMGVEKYGTHHAD